MLKGIYPKNSQENLPLIILLTEKRERETESSLWEASELFKINKLNIELCATVSAQYVCLFYSRTFFNLHFSL